ncbi:MAG: histidine kinase [Actinobacteria bacterium]|nr:histidine kinase [Actinomycetota bacterium]
MLLTGVCLIELLTRPELTNSLRAPIAVILAGATVALRRSRPLAAVGLQALVLLATPHFDDNFLPDSGQVLTLIVVYSCGAYASQRSGLVAVATLAACMQVAVGFSEFPNVELYFATLVPWWIGVQVGRRRRVASELAERNAQLEAEQDAFARLSVRRERARIARELHDIVAHHLAVIAVQAGAGRMAPAGPCEPDAERFAAIRRSGEQAMVEMAQLVDILDSDKRSGAGALSTLRVLLDEAAARGLGVRYLPLPPESRLPADVEDCAYRVVQEGLTNAIKHAPGAEVQVCLAMHGKELEIEVHDTGAAGPLVLSATGAGLGLTGMHERVESLGGSVDAGAQPGGGWCLAARLPTSRDGE